MIDVCAMSQQIYSLKMRATRQKKHISGAERLLNFPDLEEAASGMLRRALKHPRGKAEKIIISLVPLNLETVNRGPLLNISTVDVENWSQGRQCACDLLAETGISTAVIRPAVEQLAAGSSPLAGVMRGAMLVNAVTGERLEPDYDRGVRVSRMDIDPLKRLEIEDFMAQRSLVNARIIEAWVLASKVAFYPDIIAELCWSDDPDYVTGYVASTQNGYQRITHLKAVGDEIGGRIFFVKPGCNLMRLIDQLQNEPILFSPPSGECP